MAGFFALLGFILLWGFVAGIFRGGANKWFKVLSGSTLILLAIAAFYSTMDVFGVGEAVILLLLPVWLFMAGLFELFGVGAKKIKPGPSGFPEVPLKS